LVIEIRDDVIAARTHLACGLGKPRFVPIDERQTPRAREVENQTADEEQREVADCRLQEGDSKIALIETQTGNSLPPADGVTRKWVWLVLPVAAAVLLLVAFAADDAIQSWMTTHQLRAAKIIMRNVSRFGDWPTHIAIGLVGAGAAYLRGSKRWARIFAAMIVACALAGLVARVGKIATGRARPSVTTERVSHGPTFASKFNAFPSGHTAASTAFFVTLLLVRRRIGAVLLVIPVLIACSRMYVAAHFLSDVVAGAIVGVAAALGVWFWLLRTETRGDTGI
jgi:membrane-associated phospholipid phosphatase